MHFVAASTVALCPPPSPEALLAPRGLPRKAVDSPCEGCLHRCWEMADQQFLTHTGTQRSQQTHEHTQCVLNLQGLSPCQQCLSAVSEDSVPPPPRDWSGLLARGRGWGGAQGRCGEGSVRQEAGRSLTADRVPTVLRTFGYTDGGGTARTADGGAWDRSWA